MTTSEKLTMSFSKQSYTAETGFEDHGAEDRRTEGSLTFHDVSYEASVGCGRARKVILDSCSGMMRSGVNAIIGPTGSGKTTLLDILADRKARKGITGTVLVNKKRQPKNFKCISGYVIQDDLMMGVLTVRENLQFSAALRLPSHMTCKQRRERVERVIEELGLQICADTKVGTELLRGVSGGERKRTAVGMELIIQPHVLFLDEPTSGLDACTAMSVMQLLFQLSCTSSNIVILSIHQPRYSIFKLFNSLTLLSRGKVAFHGPAMQALPYFDSIGLKRPEHENPVDFFLDVIIASEDKDKERKMGSTDGYMSQKSKTMSSNEQTFLLQELKKDSTAHLPGGTAVDLVEHYQQSELYTATDKQLRSILEELQERERTGQEKMTRPANYAANFFWQILVVSFRALISTVRSPMGLTFLFAFLLSLGILIGIVYFQFGNKTITEDNLTNVINNRLGVFFLAIINMSFSNLSGIAVFLKQKSLFMHENASGYYRVSVYFSAQILSDLVPKRILPITLYAILIYFMIGFQPVASKFFIFQLTLFQISVAAVSATYAFSSMFNTVEVAFLSTSLFFIFSMLFGEFLVTQDSLKAWLHPCKYLSFFHYGIEALAINEIEGELYYANSTNSSDEPYSCYLPNCLNGTEELRRRGFETSHLWILYDNMALLAITAFFLSICFINLQLIKKHK